ncbi:MAG: hypothetical protein U1E73_06205 [Planctomycetota bacterium]
MDGKLRLAPRTFPARIADLGFSADLPLDWTAHQLPEEVPDLADLRAFVPLAVVTAPHAAMVFAFAARPAYADGSLLDWTRYLLEHGGLAPRTIAADTVADVPTVVGEATQASEMGPMVVRFAFLEDGGRLVNITLSAPELLADTVRSGWFAMLRSFRLAAPKGSRFVSTAEPAPVPAAAAGAAEPAAAPAPARPSKTTFADFALAADSESLQPEQHMNQNLRARGAGLVPRVLEVDDERRAATVAAGALMAKFALPFGWHVIDDGRRTLVFEPSGKVQIHLHRLPREGRDDTVILDDLEAQARKDYPVPEFVRAGYGRILALGVRNIADGDQPLEQYHMLLDLGEPDVVLRARVTATPDEAGDACSLAELILDSCVFFTAAMPASEAGPEATRRPASAPAAPPAADHGPEWWRRARDLEAAGEVAAAETLIRDSVQHIGCAASIAELHRLGMHRMLAAGDRAAAAAAFRRASDAIGSYASMATSGGEGAALSLERDRFRDQLRAEFGDDPGTVSA